MGASVQFQVTGSGSTALVFVHGWLGNTAWWKRQQEYFADTYTVVQIDLPGHGQSDKSRKAWSSKQYAADIKAVADQISSEEFILVGHSMSSAYVLEASLYIPKVKALVLVDTLKDMNKLLSYAQANELLFAHYKRDFRWSVENLLPKFLFAKTTPALISQQLQSEFLDHDAELAIKIIEPMYKMDIVEMAKLVKVPVRAINADYTLTNLDSNRKYFQDYDYVIIHGSGHYPMLERPDEFNLALDSILRQLSI